METPLIKLSNKFIYNDGIKPKYTQKHIDMMLEEFKCVLIDENKKYIESKSLKKLKKKHQKGGVNVEHRKVIVEF